MKNIKFKKYKSNQKRKILKDIRDLAINCSGLTCGINIVKPRSLFKTEKNPWSYIMPID